MKRIVVALSLVGWLVSCKQISGISTPDIANCPKPPASLPHLDLGAEQGFYGSFNYQIRRITDNADTITFQASNYDFVFCRGNRNWTIQPGTYQEEEPNQDFTNPPYQTVQLNDRSYQYRVLLEPTLNSQVEPKQVVFELMTPESEKPQRQILYTLEQIKQSETGVSLGVPQVTAALTYNNRLFWAVSPEQGEGNGGIATIVSYNSQADAIKVIQPEEIKGQQINDLAIAGEASNPTFWLATQVSGEGTPSIPGSGLVAYRPDSQSYQSGAIRSYHIRNSPLVGAIPTQLKLEGEQLWVGTGNGICQVQWQAAAEPKSWNCWRFALQSELPSEGVQLYQSLFDGTPATTLAGKTTEVLWWAPQAYNDPTPQGRYEVKYDEGFTVTLEEQGATSWSEFYPSSNQPTWKSPLIWPGEEWHWNGNRFVRGFDEVVIDFLGVGPSGISPLKVDYNRPPNYYAVRGDLDLLKLTPNVTQVKHYSGWVEDNLLKPYLTIVPQEPLQEQEPNPLQAIANQL